MLDVYSLIQLANQCGYRVHSDHLHDPANADKPEPSWRTLTDAEFDKAEAEIMEDRHADS